MCRYPPSTIHRYLDLPSTQIIQTHTDITPPHSDHKHKHPNQSAKHHTTTNIITRHHHGVLTHFNRTSWTTQHTLSSDHLPIITTINIRHDYRLQQNRRTFTNYKKADWTQFTVLRHRVRFHSDHHTHQHTHCQQNVHKHHTDGRQAEHTKGQDAQQLQALARRHSMQNHSKK